MEYHRAEFERLVALDREALKKEKFMHRHIRRGLLRVAGWCLRTANRLADQLYRE